MRKKLIISTLLYLSVLLISGCSCGKKADKKILCKYENEKSGDITELTVYFKNDKVFKKEYNIAYNFNNETEAKEYYDKRKLDMTGIKSLKLNENKVLMKTQLEIDNETRNFEEMKKELKSEGFVCE